MSSGNGSDVPAEVLNLGQGWFLKLSRLLAEGGFSYVYLGEDSSPTSQHQGAQPQLYAVKRMNVSTNLQKKSAMAEVDLIKQFNHPNIIQCITTHSTVRKHSSNSSTEFFYLVMEYCCPLPKTTRNEPLVGNVFKQCIDAVEYCHSFGLSHRDIKLENFMVGPDGYVKLIDFGSASTDIIKPEIDWSSKQRSIVEEELATVTTPMYRAPEIVSLWENYIIDSRVDVWALGCLLYLMWFGNHPFPDSNKLAILNGKYTLVEDEICPNFKKIISGLLKVNPEERLSFSDIKRLLIDYQVIKLEYVRPVFEDPMVPPNLMNSFPQQAASTTKSLFSSLKVGAESLFKNIRDNYYNPAAPGGPGQRAPGGPPPQQQQSRPTNRQVDNEGVHGPAPPLPPKHHRNSFGEDERVSNVLPSRPPQPPSPKPPRPPKPPSTQEPLNLISQPVVVDNLLNFGDDTAVDNQTQMADSGKTSKEDNFTKKTDADLLSDLFSSNVSTSTGSTQVSENVPAPSVDLFSDITNGSSNHKAAPVSNNANTNVNLLDDLFGSGPSVVIGQDPIPPTSGIANPGSTMPTSSSFTSLFLGGTLKPDELKKNVSSPNLTQLLGNGAGPGFSGFEFDLDLGSKPSSTKPGAPPKSNVNMSGPNYSRSLFDEKPAEAPPVRQDLNAVFGEFLNDVGFTTSNKPTTQTIGELRMEANTKDLDPITVQIRKWTKDGQNRKNIRALLSTLHTVTWPTCTWEEHPMSQMIQPIQVKKVYRRACLCVHPDKQVGTEWETLAKSIFIELNEAWSYFSQEEQQ